MMAKDSDMAVRGAAVWILPVRMRTPLKFGAQVMESVLCARVAVEVADRSGRRAVGWGETPLSVAWGWPSTAEYQPREDAMVRLTRECVRAIAAWPERGHPLEIGSAFRRDALDALAAGCSPAGWSEPIPELAALICMSPADLALHDAFGVLHGCDTFQTYGKEYLSLDLADLLGPGADPSFFRSRFPAEFLNSRPPQRLLAWHLVGGLDPLDDEDRTGAEPDDGHPVTLDQWIEQDGLTCLKVKLRGTDLDWDIERLLRVGACGLARGVRHFCADFNCTVDDPAYVLSALQAITAASPDLAARLLYIEQPFATELSRSPGNVQRISDRVRLFLDESAHDWRYVAEGWRRGWNGVALKTCKTLSGALVALAWAKSQQMDVMVQDLTNPMLAVIPHLRLAAHADTLAGVETNAMQFYPDASAPEAAVHPGAYRRRKGHVDLTSFTGPGFGMRVDEIGRNLPEPVAVAGTIAVETLMGSDAGRN
jgi:L-alanine-DL-glutamate epimerase-like enolase superfamily enzyme